MAANAGETKVKLWEGICYPENMRDDWQDELSRSLRESEERLDGLRWQLKTSPESSRREVRG